MSQLDPANTTARDIVNAAMREAGVVGQGQTATQVDLDLGQSRLQWMLQTWERKRYLVYHLVDLSVNSTGAQSYSVGPGGDIDTGVGSVRPARMESAMLRQLNTQPNEIDYPVEMLQSWEDYYNITLKTLQGAFSRYAFYDNSWTSGLGRVYFWPIPQANLYQLHFLAMAQLPASFALDGSTVFNIPYEYYNAMLYPLALRLRNAYRIPPLNPDDLKNLAKDALEVLRGANAQIPTLKMPTELLRSGYYNVFSDSYY